jgi:hypothetical protein
MGQGLDLAAVLAGSGPILVRNAPQPIETITAAAQATTGDFNPPTLDPVFLWYANNSLGWFCCWLIVGIPLGFVFYQFSFV